MNRLLSLCLVLSLLAPMTAAMPFNLEQSPVSSWFDSVQSLIERAFDWLFLASEPETTGMMESINTAPSPDKHGGFVVPSGATDDPPPTNDHGGFVVPNG